MCQQTLTGDSHADTVIAEYDKLQHIAAIFAYLA